MSTENNVSTNEVAKIKIVGYESKENILEEIIYRLSLLDKNCILLKNMPRSLSKTSLKELIPEMKTCRFPKISKKCNAGYAIIQFQNTELVSKYIELLNCKVIQGKKIKVKKFESVKKNMNIDHFDLKKLYYNGLKSETRMREITSLYPNAFVLLPTDKDDNCKGMVTLSFKTEEEALSAFAENKMIVQGLKCELNYLIKKNIGLESNSCKYNFDKPDELIKEIISRFELQNNRTVMVKNLPGSFTLVDLKKKIPSMRNCKICMDKKIGFIEFENADLAFFSVKELNGTLIKGSKVRAFVTKKAVQITDLSAFNLKKLHLTNLSMETTQSDIEALFPNCKVEMHLNTDGTCIGNATLTFNSEKEALECFSNNNFLINSVSVDINFFSDSKAAENNKKRQLDRGSDEDEEINEQINAKKIKVEPQNFLNGKTKKTNEKPDGNVSNVVTRKQSLIPKSLSSSNVIKKEAEKSITKEKKNIQVKVEKKSLVPVKQEAKEKQENNKSKIVPQKKTVKKEIKPVETKEAKIVSGKRKFQEIEKEEEKDSSVKKSRIVPKRNVIVKAKK